MVKYALEAPFSKDEEVQDPTIDGEGHAYTVLELGEAYP
jgi:hypothetical protein